jgi:hypothetical protein
MTHIIDTRSKRRPAKLAAGLALSALLLLGPLVTMAKAEQQGVQDNTSERNRARSSRDLRQNQERNQPYRDRGYYDRGYNYGAPPVVYGSPYGGSYYSSPPPVIYGPGLNINIW